MGQVTAQEVSILITVCIVGDHIGREIAQHTTNTATSATRKDTSLVVASQGA